MKVNNIASSRNFHLKEKFICFVFRLRSLSGVLGRLRGFYERLKEAKAVGAEAIVSACPWCTRNFTDAAQESGENMETHDIVDLVQRAI